MQLRCYFIFALFIGLFISACEYRPQDPGIVLPHKPQPGLIRYAKHFNIQKKEGHCVVTLFGKKNTKDTTAIFVLYDSLVPETNFNFPLYHVKVPCIKIAALSSIYAAMLDELGALNQISAIDNIDYINKINTLKKHQSGLLMKLSKGPEIDLKKTILLQPDVVLMFGMGNPEKELNVKLKKAGIPVALVVDHLEETPLARAEWIKFVGAFAGKETQADLIFKAVESTYHRLKDSIKQIKNQPKVISELKYGDTWYVPGGKSFMAALIRDAGANYAFNEDESSGSLPLSFEQVYRKASDADVWINLSMVQNKFEMLAQEERYKAFRAFKIGALYNNNKRMNAKGYSEYWETAMFHPDRVLRDLIYIFHSDTTSETDLYYYRKIK